MCVEKTPWEQTIDFHGHTCAEIALGFRVAQIAARELGIRPTIKAELTIVADRGSCALDAFQIINHATLGRGTLRVENKDQPVYHFHYSGTDQIMHLTVQPPLLELISETALATTARAKQNKTLEAIQQILSCAESDFCTITVSPGTLSPAFVDAPS